MMALTFSTFTLIMIFTKINTSWGVHIKKHLNNGLRIYRCSGVKGFSSMSSLPFKS